MLHGYINQRTVKNKGQIQFKAITFYMADCDPNFGVPQRCCVSFIMSDMLCVCKFIHCSTCTVSSGLCIGVTWLIALRGQNWPWVLGTLIYEGVKLERGGKIDLNQSLIYIYITYIHYIHNIHIYIHPQKKTYVWGTEILWTDPEK